MRTFLKPTFAGSDGVPAAIAQVKGAGADCLVSGLWQRVVTCWFILRLAVSFMYIGDLGIYSRLQIPCLPVDTSLTALGMAALLYEGTGSSLAMCGHHLLGWPRACLV